MTIYALASLTLLAQSPYGHVFATPDLKESFAELAELGYAAKIPGVDVYAITAEGRAYAQAEILS